MVPLLLMLPLMLESWAWMPFTGAMIIPWLTIEPMPDTGMVMMPLPLAALMEPVLVTVWSPVVVTRQVSVIAVLMFEVQSGVASVGAACSTRAATAMAAALRVEAGLPRAAVFSLATTWHCRASLQTVRCILFMSGSGLFERYKRLGL